MRVERLEIFGFKSFMERLILPLERGITGVVGPNGCGKSNIIDALRWVLGETRASQLRGGVLEDVIFNGTESLRPLGLAEVSVVIRAEKDSIFDELVSYYERAESSIGQVPEVALPSSVENSELVNETEEGSESLNAPVELVQSEGSLEGESEAAPALSEPVLKQDAANVDTIVSEDGSAVLADGSEQPAGEVIQESDLAANAPHDFMADIRASLSKYAWLRSVSEVQVTRRLYRSGESEFFINKVACRLKDIKELFRVLGLASRGYTIIAQGEIGRIISAKPDDRRMVIEEAAHIAGFREHINTVTKRLEDTKGQVVRLEDVIKEVTRQVANLKRQSARAVTRAQLKEELAQSERELFTDSLARLRGRVKEVEQRAGEFEQLEQTASQELSDIQRQEHEARERSMQFDVDIDQLRGNSDAIKENLNRRAREIQSKESKHRELSSLTQSRRAEINRLEDRRVVLVQRLNESKDALSTLETRAAEIEEQLKGVDVSGEEEQKEIQSRLVTLREKQRELDRSVREIRDRLVSAQSRRDALQSQMTAASPIEQLRRALGKGGEIPAEIRGECKLLVDGIRVEDRYSKALQSILAERASFLVVDEVTKVARSFQEMVLKADPANKRGLGIGLFASLGEAPDFQIPHADCEGISALLTHVESLPWARGLVTRLLSKVWLATDLDTAMRFIEREAAKGEPDPDTVVVTETGDLLSPWSFYSLRHEGGIIQMKSKVDEASRVITESQAAYDTVVKERDEVAQAISEGERRHAELSRSIQDAQRRLRELSNQQGEVRGRIQSEARMRDQLQADLERIEPQREEIQNQLTAVEESVARVAAEIAELTRQDNSELEGELQRVTASLRELEDRRKGLRDEFSQLLRTIEMKRRSHEGARDRLVRERMSAERIKGECTSTELAIRERYGDDALTQIQEASQAVEALARELREQLESRVTTIRQRLEREGEVDPGVIEQHELESKRLEELEEQRNDLVTASGTLEATLSELTEGCTRRFVSTFETIRDNFALLGPKLFGGGSAELRLVDPSNPLESGVEILVRPPGKKPKSIDLLSGGEKALCAIALVFSMFMVRPSPLCVLDEVDAPLDEANVQRYVSFIKEMSARTQFLMITHNKQSMAAADTLVGVTMPQPGASKVLTVSLQEAEKQVA